MSVPGRCEGCFLLPEACLCDDMPRADNATPVVVVRHNLEANKVSNTARLAGLCLSRCRVIDYGGPERDFDDSPLRVPGTWLVFPDGPPATAPLAPAPTQLAVVDGNWPQARRMRQRLDAFRGVRILSLPAPSIAPERLRTPPLSEGMATIEAIARALALCGDAASAAALDQLYAMFVERSLRTARYSRS